MSGPKAYRLLVLSPSELARRDLMQTRARGLALRDRLLSQFAVLSGPPPMAVPPEPASDSIQDFQAWEAALQAANQQAEALIAGQRARRRLALVAGTAPAAIQFQASQSGQPPLFASSPPPGAAAQPPLNWPVAATPNAGRVPTSPHPRSPDAVPMPPLAGPVPTSPHPPSPHAVPMPPLAGPVPTSPHPPSPGAVPAPPDAPSAEHAVRVSRALELASELEDQAAFEALAARAAPLAAARPGVVGEADLLVFEAAVADQLKADSNRKALRAEASRQALRIAHLATREAEELRQAAARADTPAAVEAVRRRADQLLDQEARQADADYASHCVAEVLTELGYAVEAGPDAIGQAPLAPDARHVMLARRPDLPGHALRLQVTDQGKLFSRVAAVRPASPAQDSAAEELTCADVLTLPAALARHGISAELSFARRPGEVELPHAGDQSRPGATRRAGGTRHTASGADKDEERALGTGDD